MAKDPAFLFYPGDYLKHTQQLSELAQVAYDRIMCAHMNNICISPQQLKFFTKRLNEDEVMELMSVLDEVEGGYQIQWVAESISKRKAFSESRANNRLGKTKKTSEKDIKNISKSLDKDMVNENEIVNDNNFKGGTGEKLKPYTPTPKVDWNNIQLPSGFSDEFKKAWEEFEQHRKELQETYSAPARQNAIMGLIRDMAINEKRCIECLRYAIGKNWKHPNTQLFKEHNPVFKQPPKTETDADKARRQAEQLAKLSGKE